MLAPGSLALVSTVVSIARESLISPLMMPLCPLSLSLHLSILLPLQWGPLALKSPRACENVLCLELDVRAESRSGMMTKLFSLIMTRYHVLFCWDHPLPPILGEGEHPKG